MGVGGERDGNLELSSLEGEAEGPPSQTFSATRVEGL